jgi:hypothetical protein
MTHVRKTQTYTHTHTHTHAGARRRLRLDAGCANSGGLGAADDGDEGEGAREGGGSVCGGGAGELGGGGGGSSGGEGGGGRWRGQEGRRAAGGLVGGLGAFGRRGDSLRGANAREHAVHVFSGGGRTRERLVVFEEGPGGGGPAAEGDEVEREAWRGKETWREKSAQAHTNMMGRSDKSEVSDLCEFSHAESEAEGMPEGGGGDVRVSGADGYTRTAGAPGRH